MQISDDIKFDLIITLTYVIMDNFCPCFFSHLIPRFYLLEKFLLLRKRNRERERKRVWCERVRDIEREIEREKKREKERERERESEKRGKKMDKTYT